MDFSPTEAQQDLAGLARDILADHATEERLRARESEPDHLDRECLRALAGAGVLAAALPESVGGQGYGLLEQCSVLVEIGRHVAPVPYLASVVGGAAALAEYGTAEQLRRWGRPAAEGTVLAAPALAEELLDDPARPTTRAEPDGSGFRITGTKTDVPIGPVAEEFLVPAATPHGPAVFLVAASDPNVRIDRQQVTDGDSAGVLELRGTPLGADRMLGPPGTGVVRGLTDRFTVGLCAHQLGVLERALELTAAYARERVQFGRPIGSFQAVAQRLADAYIDVEAARLTLWEAAWRLSEGLDAAAEVATAKFWAADAGHRVAHTAVHVHGGVGIDLDHPVHRYFLAAKRNEFALGGATAQLLRLGTELAAEPA